MLVSLLLSLYICIDALFKILITFLQVIIIFEIIIYRNDINLMTVKFIFFNLSNLSHFWEEIQFISSSIVTKKKPSKK